MKVRTTYELNAEFIVDVEVEGPCDKEETETPCPGCREEYETDDLTEDVTNDPSALMADAYAAAAAAAQGAFNITMNEYYKYLGDNNA